MRKYLMYCLLPAFSFAQSPNWLWAKSVKAHLDEEGYAVATDLSGNVYITGCMRPGTAVFDTYTVSTSGTLPPSNAGFAMFVAKYDSLGNVLWAQSPKGNVSE